MQEKTKEMDSALTNNMEEYRTQKKAREKRLMAYAEGIQKNTLQMSSALIAELRTNARTTPGEIVWRGQKDHCTECATGAENKSIWESGFARSAESRASKIYQKSTSSSHGNRTTTECLQKGVRDNVLSGTERIERSRTSGRGNDISGSF